MYRYAGWILACWLTAASSLWSQGPRSGLDPRAMKPLDAHRSLPLSMGNSHSTPVHLGPSDQQTMPAPVMENVDRAHRGSVLFLVSDEEDANGEDLPEPSEAEDAGDPEADADSDAEKAKEKAAEEKKKQEQEKKKKEKEEAKARKTAANQQRVAEGEAAFNRSCVDCHDAERAFEKRKSKAGWLSTIRRMAKMDGADVSESDFEPIAVFLVSRQSGGSGGGASSDADNSSSDSSSDSESDEEDEEDGSSESDEADADVSLADDGGIVPGVSLGGTVSTIWRGGNDNLENPDFFPDIWLSGDWQPEGPLSGRVTACTSCHSDRTNGSGFTFELVEASAKFDLLYKIKQRRKELGCKDECEWDASIKAGRLVVPFGAFAAMSHPGVYRTLTNPLMYNMGRQVNPDGNRPPVLPMPYSDEGVDLNCKIPILDEIYGTMDIYAVNGLQGFGNGVQFSPSRSYADNNRLPAIGARTTLGTSDLRFGGSWMSGRMEPEGSDELGYKLSGADVTWRYENFLRAYAEYARRKNDTDVNVEQAAWGYVAEVEILVWEDPNIGLLLRYDTLDTRGRRDETTIDRYTWGVNTTLPGGSLLIFNHERWNYATRDVPDTDVVGLRWVVTF